MDTTIKSILVHHERPDLEACVMSYVICSYDDIREKLNVVEHPDFGFTPAGKRRADLRDEDCLYLDCGGEELDQHGKPEHQNRNSVSSLGYLTHETKLDVVAPHLVPLISIVNQNDLKGKEVAVREDWRKSSTPHTERHLRNVITGLGLRYKDRPKEVVRIVHTILGVIDLRLKQTLASEVVRYETLCAEVQAAHAALRCGCPASDGDPAAGIVQIPGAEWLAAMAPKTPRVPVCPKIPSFAEMVRKTGIDFREYFLVSRILDWAPAYFGPILGLDQDPAILIATRQLASDIEDALMAMEEEWKLAERDYPHVRRWPVIQRRMTERGEVCRTLSVLYGRSRSSRFGAVTRFCGRADVTVQFYAPGKFVIATNDSKLYLDRVAQVLREADLRRKGVDVTEADRQLFAKPGNLRYADKDGRMHDALFLTEYRTNFGNSFRSCPDAEETALTEQEVVDLTLGALTEGV